MGGKWWQRSMMIGGLIFFGLAIIPFYWAGHSHVSGYGGIGVAIVTVAISLILLFISALFFAYGYLPMFAQGMIFELLAPRRFLSEAPPELARLEGLIANAKYEEAEIGLKEVLAIHPGNAAAVGLIGTLYLDKLHQPQLALPYLDHYLEGRDRATPGDSRIVIMLSDMLLELNALSACATMLARELKTKGYAKHERYDLKMRLDAVNARLNAAAIAPEK